MSVPWEEARLGSGGAQQGAEGELALRSQQQVAGVAVNPLEPSLGSMSHN